MKIVKYENNNVDTETHLPGHFTSKEPSAFLESIRSLTESKKERIEILPENREDALLLIHAYVESIDSQTTVPKIIEKYIANSLRVILSGFPIEKDKLEHAFRLRGEQQGAFNERDLKITNDFIDLLEDGKSANKAGAALAEIYHRDISRIKNIYKEHKDEVQFFRDFFKDESEDHPTKGTPLSKILE